MTNKEKLMSVRVRLHQLKNNGKNFESPGVVKKLQRKVKRLEKLVEAE